MWVSAAVSSAKSTDLHLYQLPSLEIEIIPMASFIVVPRKYITYGDVSCHKELTLKLTCMQCLRVCFALYLQSGFIFHLYINWLLVPFPEQKRNWEVFIFLFGGEVILKVLDKMKLSPVMLVQLSKANPSRHLNDSLMKTELESLVSSLVTQ